MKISTMKQNIVTEPKEIKKPLKLQEAIDIYKQFSILIGNQDSMPLETAKKLLNNDKALDFAFKFQDHKNNLIYNAYYVDEKKITFLTINGFLTAVTYKNLTEFQQLEDI